MDDARRLLLDPSLLAASSDAELLDACFQLVTIPRRDPADSFVLHAPLELLARAALLRWVAPPVREEARARLVASTLEYDGYEALEPAEPAGDAGPLGDALDAGDVDAADASAASLAGSTTAPELVAALADLVITHLGAAAHAVIFLDQLPRFASQSAPAAAMVRGLVRELAREPGARLRWLDERAATPAPDAAELVERLRRPPSPGNLGTAFIRPTMTAVEATGTAAELLDDVTAGLDVASARRALLRVAAWSMLQDDPAHAPYGWTHCLTLPQAALAVAPACSDPSRAVGVAATFVLGFRATLGSVSIDPRAVPDAAEARSDLEVATPVEAAAAVYHAAPDELADHVRTMAAYAAGHRDAHLAKYTVACLDATRDDPGAGRLYLAAAAHLGAWWRQRGTDTAPIG